MLAKPKVYIETTIISYLTARPSNELLIGAHQELTNKWWNTKKDEFDLYVSELVIQEAGSGDEYAAKRRIESLELLPRLKFDVLSRNLAAKLARATQLPVRAAADAAHIAIAVANGMDYLLTWNCRHIANAQLRRTIEEVCELQGFSAPIICTPEELMENLSDDT